MKTLVRCPDCGDRHDCRKPSARAAAELKVARRTITRLQSDLDYWRDQTEQLSHADWMRALEELARFKEERRSDLGLLAFAAIAAGQSAAVVDRCFSLPPGTAEAFSESVQINANEAWLQWQVDRGYVDGVDLFHDFDHPASTIQRGVDPWRAPACEPPVVTHVGNLNDIMQGGFCTGSGD